MKKYIILATILLKWACVNSIAQAARLEVTLYEHSNFIGKSLRLGVGKFNLAQYEFTNKLSSIKVPDGLIVKINGGSKGWRNLWMDLDNFDAIRFHDVATEIEILGPYAILVKNRNFMKEGSDILCLPEGNHAVTDGINEMNQFGSTETILIPKGYRVTLSDGNGVNLSSEGKIDFNSIRQKNLDGRIRLVNVTKIGDASSMKSDGYSEKAAKPLAKMIAAADETNYEETDEKKPPIDNKLILNQEAINAFEAEAGTSKMLRFIADTIEIAEPIMLKEKQIEFFCNYLFGQKDALLKIVVPEGQSGGSVIGYCKKIDELLVNLTGGNGVPGKLLKPHRLQGNVLGAVLSRPHWANSMKGESAGNGGNISIYTINQPGLKAQLHGGRGGRGASPSYVVAEEQIPKLLLKFRPPSYGMGPNMTPQKGLIQADNQWNNCYIIVPVPAGINGNNGRSGKQTVKILPEVEFEEIAGKALGGIGWKSLKNRAYRWEHF